MKLLICALLAATTNAIRNGHPRPMPRSQPTTLETLLGRDPYNIIDVRGGGIFDDPDEEPEDRELEERPMCRNCASEPSRKSALF